MSFLKAVGMIMLLTAVSWNMQSSILGYAIKIKLVNEFPLLPIM